MIQRYIKTNKGLMSEALEKKLIHANLFFKIDISRKARSDDYIDARAMFCDYIYKTTRSSKSSIGIALGGRDHSTVINALAKHEDLMYSSPSYRKTYAQFCEFMDDMGGMDLSSFENRLVNADVDKMVGTTKRFLQIHIDEKEFQAIHEHARRLNMNTSQYFLRCGIREYLRALEL